MMTTKQKTQILTTVYADACAHHVNKIRQAHNDPLVECLRAIAQGRAAVHSTDYAENLAEFEKKYGKRPVEANMELVLHIWDAKHEGWMAARGVKP